MILQTDNVTLKEKTTKETHGYVGVYTYVLKSASGQTVLLVASCDDGLEVGQEFELLLRPVEGT